MALGFVKRILPSWKNAALALLAAGLLILAFPDFEYWFLAWFALAPLMWAVERETSLQRPARSKGTDSEVSVEPEASAISGSPYYVRAFATIRSFFLGWLFGTAFFFGTCWWLTYAPIHYAAFPWPLAYFLILIVCLGAGVFPAIFAAVLSALLKRFGSWAFLAAPFVWVFSEFLRYWLTGNNWNAIGYSQAFVRDANFHASYGGIYLVGFPLVTFGAFVFWSNLSLIRADNKRPIYAMVVVFWGCVALILSLWGPTEATLSELPEVGVATVIALQPNVPMSGVAYTELGQLRQRQFDLSETELKKLQTANRQLPTKIILPESPMNFMYNDDREFQQFIGDFARKNNVSVLFNSAEPDATNGKYFNSAMMIGADGKVVAQYDKIYLLPFGEAVPVPLDAIVPGFVGNFSYGREYDLLPLGDAKAGVMICFESHFGQLSRRFVADGADVIIEMTNDGYLGPTPVLRQHLANAVFRAVETNRPVLRVTNVGITAYITEKGAVLDPTAAYQEDTRVWTVSKSDGSQTFYVKYGDWFAWLCSVVTVGLLGFSLFSSGREEIATESNTLTVAKVIDPDDFWNREHTYNPPLTDDMVIDVESQLGVRLPIELIELLRVQNGGYTTGFVFPTHQSNSWASDHFPFSEASGINLDRENFMFNFFVSSRILEEWQIPEKLILLSGDGHYFVTLDYRITTMEPTVAWIDFECNEDMQIAGSFKEFLAGLVRDSEFESKDLI